MQLNDVYFWTDTVKDWKHLLKQDKYKQTIIETWKWLKDKGFVNIYGFVIIPNHLHVISEMLAMNGKEMPVRPGYPGGPHASFNKITRSRRVTPLRYRLGASGMVGHNDEAVNTYQLFICQIFQGINNALLVFVLLQKPFPVLYGIGPKIDL